MKVDVLAPLIKHPVLGGSKRWILFSPLSGLTFVTPLLRDAFPEECLVLEAPIKGHMVASIDTEGGTHTAEALISTKGTLTLFNDKLSLGGLEAHLKVDGLVRLNGDHMGRAWGYHAL